MRAQSTAAAAVLAVVVVGLIALCSAAPLQFVCTADEDCNLNGVCSGGVCNCDPWWQDDDCGALNLRPARRNTGYNRTSELISSWGAKIVKDPKVASLYHLFAAEFINHCGLDYWSPNSRVIRAVSFQPDGPFEFAEEVLGTFHHNPTIVWSESDQLWLLYTIGCNTNDTLTCSTANNSSPSDEALLPADLTCSFGNTQNGESGISLFTSPTLYGPWQPHVYVLDSNTLGTWDCDTTNPSPLVLKDGSILLMYRGCSYQCGNREMIGLAWADRYDANYTRLFDEPLFLNPNEDPFIWRDSRGNFHALMHSLEPGGAFGDGPKVGRHAFSRDAKWWTFGSATLAYSTNVQFDDGTSIDYFRRERPQLYFENGVPLFLVTGVQEKNQKTSYTLVQPLAAE